MTHYTIIKTAMIAGIFFWAHTQAASAGYDLESCPPAGYDRQALLDLKATEFKLDDVSAYDALALALIGCLGDPDPALRDGIAYEGLFALLRSGHVSDDTKRLLLTRFTEILLSDEIDQQGFVKPFVVLGLAEVARADRIKPYLTQKERRYLTKTGAVYLKSIKDYRGFDKEEGWRHGVAHASDLLMQLSLNENIGLAEHRMMMKAVASQVSPQEVFYIYGESERLARPIIFIAARGMIDEEEWSQWLQSISAPAPLSDWSQAFHSQIGLAKRHNTTAFLSSLFINASVSSNEDIKALLPGITEALRKLP